MNSPAGATATPASALAEAERIAKFGYWDLDLKRNKLAWSNEIYRIFEVDPEKFDASYEAFLGAIHPEDREYVNAAYTDSVKKRAPYNIVHRLQMKDGRIKYVRERCETFYDPSGQPLRSIGTVQDITEPQLTFEALRASERALRALFEEANERARKLAQAERIAHVGSWEVDLSANRLIYSEEALNIHGLSREAFDGTLSMAIDLAHPDDRLRVTAAINATLYEGKAFDIEYRIVRPDGGVRYVHAEDEVMRDASGKPLRAVGITQDITERKLVEQALRRFRVAMDVSVDSIYLTDPVAMRFVDVNSAACRRTGYTREQLLGMGPQDLLDKDLAKVQHEYQEVLAAGDAGVISENTFLTSDGSRRWTELYRRAFDMEGGRLVVTVGRDITERKSSEAALSRFRTAVDASGDAIVLIDRASMRYVDVNRTTCEMTGYTREELLGMSPMDLFGTSREALERDYDEIIADRYSRATRTEGWYLRKDGVRVPIETRRRAVQTLDGWVIVGTARDITDRKEADAKIARLNRLYAVLSGINSTIVRIQDGAELYEEACRILVQSGQLALAYICVIDPVDQRLKLVASAGSGAAAFLAGVQGRMSLRDDEPAGYGPPALAARQKQPIVVNDIAADARIQDGGAHLARGIRSAAALPICVNGEQVAVLGLHAAEAGFFDEQQMRLLVELAGDIGFALDHIEKAKRLDYLAFYDQLTGLANRRLFLDRLAQTLISAGQAGEKAALLLVDMERLATVNESLGRQAGDALVTQLAERLTRSAGSSDVARVSANHFAVLFRSIKGRSEVLRRCDRLWQECFGASFRIADSELRSSARGGLALFPSSADAEALLQNAEAALRRAKQTGERLVFHAPEMTAKTTERLSLENQLRLGLDRREFVLHYQPKVDLDTGRIAGVEALMRWQSPELGLVPPLKFIPVMEETGMILDAGAWALASAIEDHKRWRELGLAAPRVAVNVSAVQLRQKSYVAALAQALGGGAQPVSIDLEITESVVMEDIQGNIEKLKEARGLGVSVAIDDFGTGYSSLGYLARLPVQALKIDRSFITAMLDDPATMTLVQTIISLAHSLRLKVIAEGVESEEQARTLRLLRCDEMQGYLFSKPLPFEAMSRLLAATP
ncbi:MAG TPA: EAL domain-containing protein [Burkholderiales bacterium]|nr:EAL domain-containing protein [Burkholderiales bacterium]